MRAVLIATLAAVGALLLLSATWNVDAKETKWVATQSGPYSAWAHGERSTASASTFQTAAVTQVAVAAAEVAPAFAMAPSSATAIASSPPPPPPPPRRKACAPGCEKRGVCNTELGRCDCPPFVGGDDCSKPLIAACGAAVGLTELAPAPCVYDQLSINAPVSCECLLGCEALGLMGRRECYVMDSSNHTVTAWVQKQIHVRGLTPNEHFWESSLKGAHKESVERCGGRGVYAPRMPDKGAPPPHALSQKRCWCYAGFAGDRCERSATVRQERACLNGCSARGTCVRNWCHCKAGFYGVDCSMGSGSGEGPSPPPLPPPIGAQELSKAPRVYIYDLPPRFNSWMHAGDAGWWQDFDLWGEDVIIHRRAMRSMYRVDDPEQADVFLVPVWVSSAMWQMNWGFRDLLPTGVRTVGEAASYIRATWPYFDRKGGSDHLWVFGHDQGGWRVRAKLPVIAKGIFISPFGGGPAQRGGHEPNHDIVCPSVLYSGVPYGLLNHVGRKKKPIQNHAFFQGKLNLHIPYEYSFGIRQGLFKAHRNNPRIVVKEGHEANREAYYENMCGSRFCVAAAGFGFSTRAYEASVAGCVPLIMQDGIEQAYEDLLPWSLFSMRINNSLAHLSNLTQVLEAVPESTVRALRSKLYCVWPRFLWLRHDPGAQTPLPSVERLLKFDAFESIMWTLRKRLRGDIGWPADWDEGCREVTRYFATSPTGRDWAPWANYDFDRPT